MKPELYKVFSALREWDVAITGSVLRDYDAAGDIDVLFPASQDFRQLARELGIKYRGGFEGDGGRVHSLKYRIPEVDKEINLIQRTGVEEFRDWPHEVLLRNGKVLNKGQYLDKAVLKEPTDGGTLSDVPDEDDEKPTCCWCDAPLKKEGKSAWCSGSEECRQKQIACAVTIEKDGHVKYLFVPTPRQAESMMCATPNLFVWGNRGGGKSVCMRWFCHALACAVPGFKYAILRTSFPELMKNHLIYLEDEMNQLGGEGQGFKYHKTDHVCYYSNGSIGFYAQCANDADVKKILGAEVALVVFDEAPTFQWEHMQLIKASIRVPEGSGLTPMTRYLGNPIGESIDELWKYFIDKDVNLADDPEYRPNDYHAIEMRIQDNPHLDRKQYWKQFSGLPAHWLKAWREGVRIDENALFQFFPSLNGKPFHVIHEVPRLSDGTPIYTIDAKGRYHFLPWVKVYRAYDHGFHPDPACCLWFAVFGRRILCFKEMTWSRTLAKTIGKIIADESKGMPVVTTYCDPSIDIDDGDVTTIKEKIELGGKFPMDCSTNNREYFADAIHSGLDDLITKDTPRLQFLGKHTPMVVKYLPRMKFNEKNPAALADHKHDHWIVALAYFLMSQIPETKPTETTKPRRWQLPKKNRKSAGARMMERLARKR
jgi:hypothetical protein